MRIRQRHNTILLCLASFLAILVCVPAHGHDPLSDEEDHQYHEYRFDRHSHSEERVDLSAVRLLVIAFRETGDDSHLDEAWILIEPALKSASADAETLIAASFVAQSRHEFAYAMQLITMALAINVNNDGAWLLLASIQLVLGDANAAAVACGKLRNVPLLVLMTCQGRVALVSGKHKLAYERLSGVLDLADSLRLPSDLLAWSYSVAADLAVASGEPQQALELYQDSLDIAERTQVRAAMVDVLLNEARYENAWQVLEAGAPALPLLVRRLITAKKLDRMDSLESILQKVQSEFAVWIADKDWLHAREMARFFIDVVDRPQLARRLALINVNLQREPEDLRLEARTRYAVY